MPLLLDFKSGDKIIINGAVVENSGAHAKLLIHNKAAILRGSEVLSEADAQTPASRVYFALQCAYIFPAQRVHYLTAYEQLLSEYHAACPSAGGIVQEIGEVVQRGELYKALKISRKLIFHEMEVTGRMQDARQARQEAAKHAAEEQHLDEDGSRP